MRLCKVLKFQQLESIHLIIKFFVIYIHTYIQLNICNLFSMHALYNFAHLLMFKYYIVIWHCSLITSIFDDNNNNDITLVAASAGPSDLKSSVTQGVCPTLGCRGVGHIRGAKYTGHHR